MPFTIAHPAAVIPLAHGPLTFSALIIGSMAPDFAYFSLPSAYHHAGHTPAGLFTFCLPVGLLSLLIFHGLLKAPLLSLMPDSHQAALAPAAVGFRVDTGTRFFSITLSLLIGAASHILWDSFTHEGAWAVRHIALLNAGLVETPYGTLRVYKLLQHGSTVVGTLVLIRCYRNWQRRAEWTQVKSALRLSPRGRAWVIITILTAAAAVGLAYGAWKAPALSDLTAAGKLVREVVIMSMATAIAGAVLYSVGWHLKRQNQL